MQIKLELYHVKEILRNGFNLDMVVLLKLAEEGHILKDIAHGDAKLEIIYQGLVRKGLITTENKITLAGKNLLKFTKEEAPKEKLTKSKPDSSEFEKWWAAFPGTDIFTHKGKTFKGTRTLRVKKDDCRLKFNAIMAEGEYDAQTLISALQFDVLNKKENSVKANDNKLKYLHNSLTYLTQRSFEPYIELVKEGITVGESKQPNRGIDV